MGPFSLIPTSQDYFFPFEQIDKKMNLALPFKIELSKISPKKYI